VKVLYFYQYFTTPKGAWSTRVYEFAQRWMVQGDSVTVVTSIYDKSDLRSTKWLTRQDIDGIDVRVINVRLSNRHGFLTRLCTFALYAIIACWYAITVRADVVVSSSGPISVALPGLVARYLRGRPLVFEVRDLWPECAIEMGILRNRVAVGLARLLEAACYRAASRVIALSEGMGEWIENRYGIHNIGVVPNVANSPSIEETGRIEPPLPAWAESRKLVLYSGTLGVANDCRLIVEMCRFLQHWEVQDIAVVVFGDGRERVKLEEIARSNGLSNIYFLGLVPKTTVVVWLRRALCSLLVLRNVPSLSMGSPNKMLDSLANGVPVVENTQGWVKALIGREECGLSVPPDDAEALARAVVALARDGSLRGRLAANASRVAREQFDCDVLANRMREILLSSY